MQPLACGVVVARRYEIQRCLGQGGMGSVWAAHDRRLRRDVAVKILADIYADVADVRVRFEREAQAAAGLDSQHVVQVFDFGIEDGAPYLVMEQLKGESLADRLDRQRRLSLRVAASLAQQIAAGLSVAHEAGIVHRDLKPPNVFLAQKDGREVVKILDFGIAKLLRPEPGLDMTRTRALLGTPTYMSPEQVRGARHVDHRTDLWALGVILFQAVTGKEPFEGQAIGDISVKICADPIPVPSDVAPDLPREVDAFFARALERNLELRFSSAREMADAFSSLSAGADRPGGDASSLVANQALTAAAPFLPTSALPGTLAPAQSTFRGPASRALGPALAAAAAGVVIVTGGIALATLVYNGARSSAVAEPSAAAVHDLVAEAPAPPSPPAAGLASVEVAVAAPAEPTANTPLANDEPAAPAPAPRPSSKPRAMPPPARTASPPARTAAPPARTAPPPAQTAPPKAAVPAPAKVPLP